jgi:FkbM family methyltransferase
MRYLKTQIKSYLATRGYKLEFKPKPLIANPNAELQVTFDHIVSYHLLKNPDFYFVQIGALDGIFYDPIYKYVNRYKWKGVLVEPQEKYFQILQTNYQGNEHLVFKKVAISDKRGTKILYKVRDSEEDLPEWVIGLASFKLETILSHKPLIPNLENLIDEEIVECMTLSDLFNEIQVKKIDLLQIDVEGYDYEIIKMLDFNQVKPSIIHFEHGHLPIEQFDECLEILINQNYAVTIEKHDTTAYFES